MEQDWSSFVRPFEKQGKKVVIVFPWGEDTQGFLPDIKIWKPQDPLPKERVEGQVSVRDFSFFWMDQPKRIGVQIKFFVTLDQGKTFVQKTMTVSTERQKVEDYLLERSKNVEMQHEQVQWKDAIVPAVRQPMSLDVFKKLDAQNISKRFGIQTTIKIHTHSQQPFRADWNVWIPNQFGPEIQENIGLFSLDKIVGGNEEAVRFQFAFTRQVEYGSREQEQWKDGFIIVLRASLLDIIYQQVDFIVGSIQLSS